MRKQDTFGAFIKQERARLQTARDKSLQKKSEVDQELAAIGRELAAITAYEQAKGGKPAQAGKRAAAKPVGKRTGGQRSPQGREAAGCPGRRPARGEILKLMGVKGDKSGEQSVSNALSALSKQNQLGSVRESTSRHSVPLRLVVVSTKMRMRANLGFRIS
jgi:hypothetical protein